jgi:hypothetical protein
VGARKLRVDSEIKNAKLKKNYPIQQMKKKPLSVGLYLGKERRGRDDIFFYGGGGLA